MVSHTGRFGASLAQVLARVSIGPLGRQQIIEVFMQI